MIYYAPYNTLATLISARVPAISDKASAFDASLAFALSCLEFVGDKIKYKQLAAVQ